ncbi:FAD:protein FMN transferase [Capillibacterium thermochitinicola]|uniref:FAD:protein FMN transferase n=1 Tax=Capillibacterium thermochitinicola TaxID=2699427 RepID=UPI001E577898
MTRRRRKFPPRGLLEEAARFTALEGMIIDESASTVYLTEAGMRLDVGAVAKGYAVERVAQSLEAEGVSSLLLSVGGEYPGDRRQTGPRGGQALEDRD